MPTKTKAPAKAKKSGGADVIYNMVTERIIAALEEGTVPWKKTWISGGGLHYNMVTKIPYKGINPFLLSLTAAEKNFSSPYWLSLKQVKALKGRVIDSEFGDPTIVIFWKILTTETDEIDPKTGKWKVKKTPLLRFYKVYNIEQTEGIDPKKVPNIPRLNEEFTPIERADKALAYKGRPKVRHTDVFNPAYNPRMDTVIMPLEKQFHSTEDYYVVRFHEEIHGTGAEKRLNRPGIADFDRFGSDQYAEEELVAQMGSAMLAAQFEVDGDDQRLNDVAYIQSWIKRFKEDKKLLVNAAAKAQKACEYILNDGKAPEYK